MALGETGLKRSEKLGVWLPKLGSRNADPMKI